MSILFLLGIPMLSIYVEQNTEIQGKLDIKDVASHVFSKHKMTS